MENQKVTTTNSGGKKSSKPIMEKRRRARINASLAELKSLLLDAIKREGTRHSKMEKADILEMAVRHLKEIQNHPFRAATNPSSAVLSKYVMGFQACAGEVSKYLSTDGEEDLTLKTKLLNHLSNCLADGDSPFTSSSITSLSVPSSSSMEDSTIEEINNNAPSSSSFPSSGALLQSLHKKTLTIRKSSSEPDLLVGLDADKDSTLSHSLVSSSTSSLTRLPLSSSSSSSSSSNFLSSPSEEPLSSMIPNSIIDAADQASAEIKNDIRMNRHHESIIIKTRFDEGTDESIMFSDVDEDDVGPITDTMKKQESRTNCCNSIETEGKILNDDNNNNIRSVTIKSHIEASPAPTNLISLPQQNVPGIPLSTIPVLQPNVLFHQLQQHFPNLQQQLPQKQQQPQLLKQPQPLDQIYISPMKTLPCVGSNVQLFPSQANPKEIAFVLPTNFLSAAGNIPKFYIPLMPPSTLQTSATLIAPHIFQPNQVSAIQLETVQATPPPQQQQQQQQQHQLQQRQQQQNHLIPLAHQGSPQESTKTDLGNNGECSISVANNGNPAVHKYKDGSNYNNSSSNNILSETLQQNSHEEHLQKNLAQDAEKSESLSSLASSCGPANPITGLVNTHFQITPCNNNNSPISLSTVSVSSDNVCASTYFYTKGLQEMQRRQQLQQQQQQQQQLQLHAEDIEKPSTSIGNIDKVDFPSHQYHTMSTNSNINAGFMPCAMEVSAQTINSLPHNSSVAPVSSSSAVINSYDSPNSHIDSNLKPTTVLLSEPCASDFITRHSSNYVNSPYRKRPCSPSPNFDTKNYRTHYFNYEQPEEAKDSNVLDLSIPGVRQEDGGMSLGPHKNNNCYDSPMKETPLVINSYSNTSVMTERKEMDTSTQINGPRTGSFFRPW